MKHDKNELKIAQRIDDTIEKICTEIDERVEQKELCNEEIEALAKLVKARACLG